MGTKKQINFKNLKDQERKKKKKESKKSGSELNQNQKGTIFKENKKILSQKNHSTFACVGKLEQDEQKQKEEGTSPPHSQDLEFSW